MLCAAKHPTLPGDLAYIEDDVHYLLAVEWGLITPDEDEEASGRWHLSVKGTRWEGWR